MMLLHFIFAKSVEHVCLLRVLNELTCSYLGLR